MSSTYSKAQIKYLQNQYLPRLSVKDADIYLRKSEQKSKKIRNKLSGVLDISYGNSPLQKLDIFPSEKKRSPVNVFIHGGYWRAPEIEKRTYSFIAKPLVSAGATLVVPNYDLCPSVNITTIVQQMRNAIKWVYKNIEKYNGDPKRIFISGHSAGGHLTAMMAATDWSRNEGLPKSLIKGIAPLSGLFDLETHRHLPLLQPDLKLTKQEVETMSPMYHTPIFKGKAIVAVGEKEPDLFHWQSLRYTALLRYFGISAEFMSMPSDNHFSITDRLGRRNDILVRALLRQMDL